VPGKPGEALEGKIKKMIDKQDAPSLVQRFRDFSLGNKA
jgi:hypothetical protein